MNRDFYVQRAECILGDSSAYEKINGDGDKKLIKSLSKFINNYADQLTDKEIQYLTNFDYATSNFYRLPKIHKSEVIARAI